MIKNILSLIILTLSFSALAVDANETTIQSQLYIKSVLEYLDQTKSNNLRLSELNNQIKKAASTARSSDRDLDKATKTLKEKEDRLSSLTGKITRLENRNVSHIEASQDIFETRFPGEGSIDSVISNVTNQRKLLVDEQLRLQTALDSENRSFDQQILRKEAEITTARTTISQLEEQQIQNRQQVESINGDIRKLTREIRELQRIKNAPGFAGRHAAAQVKFEETKLLKEQEQRNCKSSNFFGAFRDKSATCKAYRQAQSTLRNLDRIASGKPIQEKRNQVRELERNVTHIRNSQPALRRQIQSLTEDIGTARRQLERLEDNKSITTRPIRTALAEANFNLQTIERKWSYVQTLTSLRNNLASNNRNISRYKREQGTLPSVIQDLQLSLSDFTGAAQINNDTLTALTTEKEELVKIDQDTILAIENMRSSMKTTQSTNLLTVVPPAATEPIDASTVIFESKDWMVSTSEDDVDWSRASCKAETELTTSLGELELEMFATLSVVNLKNSNGTYNEPLVSLSVSAMSGIDLNAYKEVVLQASSSRTEIELDLIYSMSDEENLLFIAKLSDREELIRLIAAKNTMGAKLISVDETSENISFSLRGSSRALKGTSSRDLSLRQACGGIEVSPL